MKKAEWLRMMEQDSVTVNENKKPPIEAVLSVVKEILKDYPENTEIDQKISVEKIFDNMKKEARKNCAANNFYYFTPTHAKDFIKKELELDSIKVAVKKPEIVNLDDFL